MVTPLYFFQLLIFRWLLWLVWLWLVCQILFSKFWGRKGGQCTTLARSCQIGSNFIGSEKEEQSTRFLHSKDTNLHLCFFNGRLLSQHPKQSLSEHQSIFPIHLHIKAFKRCNTDVSSNQPNFKSWKSACMKSKQIYWSPKDLKFEKVCITPLNRTRLKTIFNSS